MITLPKVQSQTDSRWSGILLGFNTDKQYSIGNYGCLITCLSMACSYYGYDTDPKDLNEKLKKVNGFISGGLYVWGSISKVTPKVVDTNIRIGDVNPASDSQMSHIRTALDSKMPVMFHIDYNPKTAPDDMHWVLAIGYNPSDENDFTIVDPIDGKTKSLKSYLGWYRPDVRRTLIDYCVLSGTVSSTLKDTKIDFDDAERKRKTVGWYVYEWNVEKTSRIDADKSYEEVNDAFSEYRKLTDGLLGEKNAEIEKLTQQNKKLTLEVERLKNQLLDQGCNVEKCLSYLVQTIQEFLKKKNG